MNDTDPDSGGTSPSGDVDDPPTGLRMLGASGADGCVDGICAIPTS